MNLDERIQLSVVATLTARPAALEAGPFVLGLDPATASTHVNYATPRPGVPISADDVDSLVEAFARASRRPRLEYVTACAPGLEELLLSAGFQVEERHDYLVCTPDTLLVPPPPPGYDLREPSDDAARAALISAQNTAFGGDPQPGADAIARMSTLQSRGGAALLASTSGVAAGVGPVAVGPVADGSVVGGPVPVLSGAGGSGVGAPAAGGAKTGVSGAGVSVSGDSAAVGPVAGLSGAGAGAPVVGGAAAGVSAVGGPVAGGVVVGGGQAGVPQAGVSELAGIAIAPEHRRRGLAGAVTAGLAARVFASGADMAWLEASGAESWRVYERVGFRAAGKRLYISMP